MMLRDAVGMALETIRVQKLKSFFSLIGVLIGVTFLIAVVSIVQGMNVYMEDKFANKFLAGKASLQDFPYYESYVGTIKAEASLLPAPPRRMLFIGSGPVPLSAILFKREFPESAVDIADINLPALRKGARVARKAGTPLGKQLLGDAATMEGLRKYDAVVVSLEVGPTTSAKNSVIQNFAHQPGPIYLLRGSPPGL